jgi:hypothetical protein
VHPTASDLLIQSFELVVLGVALAWVLATGAAGRRLGEPRGTSQRWSWACTALLTGWLAATSLLAQQGRLLRFEPSPPLALLVLASLCAATALALTRPGARLAAGLPLWALVALQGFRLPLELVMHRAASEGVMPPQMSFSGANFDVLTGASAPVVALLLARGSLSHRAIGVWNAAGLLLLANVVTLAALSAPGPLRAFENDPPNVWVDYFPFVWLPTFLVTTAFALHLLVWRRLRFERRRERRLASGTPVGGRLARPHAHR